MHPEDPEKQEKGWEKVFKAMAWVLFQVPRQSLQQRWIFLLAPVI